MKSKLLLLAGLLLTARLSGNIWRIWKTGDRITRAQSQLDAAQKEQQELKKRLAEVQSPEFVEKEAREKLGYGKEGEIIVILPKTDGAKGQVLSAKENKPNWKKWWDLYIGI